MTYSYIGDLPTRKYTMTDPEPPPARAAPPIAVTNLKIPPFWPADPQLWFAQVEAQFTTRHITPKVRPCRRISSS